MVALYHSASIPAIKAPRMTVTLKDLVEEIDEALENVEPHQATNIHIPQHKVQVQVAYGPHQWIVDKESICPTGSKSAPQGSPDIQDWLAEQDDTEKDYEDPMLEGFHGQGDHRPVTPTDEFMYDPCTIPLPPTPVSNKRPRSEDSLSDGEKRFHVDHKRPAPFSLEGEDKRGHFQGTKRSATVASDSLPIKKTMLTETMQPKPKVVEQGNTSLPVKTF